MLQQAVGGDDLTGETAERRVRVRVDKGVTTCGRWRQSYGQDCGEKGEGRQG